MHALPSCLRCLHNGRRYWAYTTLGFGLKKRRQHYVLEKTVTSPDHPSCDIVVQSCDAAGYCQDNICLEVAGRPRFWVKYGAAITLGEVRTQKEVADILSADPCVVGVSEVYLVFLRGWRRCITMQHVEGTTVESRQSITGRYAKGDL